MLSGLHSLADLHADDVDFGLAVLQHLQSRLEHLLVLREGGGDKAQNEQRGGRKSWSVGPRLARFAPRWRGNCSYGSQQSEKRCKEGAAAGARATFDPKYALFLTR